MSFFQWQGNDLVLYAKIQPKASKDELVEIISNETQNEIQVDQLKIRITAPPVDGKANKHLIAFLSKLFGIARSQISLLSGETGRNKKLLIKNPKRLPDKIMAIIK